MDYARAHYDDGTVTCDETGLAIQRYYPWGARRIFYGEIRDLTVLPLSSWGARQPWRIWGPVDLEHWWNLDPHRTERHVALVIDTGERFKPTITPCDPGGFEKVVRAHLSGLAQLRAASALARLTAGEPDGIPEISSGISPEIGPEISSEFGQDIPAQRSVEAMVPEPTTRVSS